METIKDIIKEIRRLNDDGFPLDGESSHPLVEDMRLLADRIEAAHKREVDSIHRAMVLIAGIEMKDSENPPRLWTALEDAYDALSDALGTDGETTADVAEAKAIGRHFVIEPVGNTMKMREALKKCTKRLDAITPYLPIELRKYVFADIQEANITLSAQPRNCDLYSNKEKAKQAWAKLRYEYMTTDLSYGDWLFTEVKGE